MTARGLGGVAATDKYVIISDRDAADRADVFTCFHADTGKVAWEFRQPAPGSLDYGTTARATPVIEGRVAFLFGAFGHLHCVDLETGEARWQLHLETEFGPVADRLPWGLCATPLLVEGKLIVAPGSVQASLAALDAASGAVLWRSPGGAPGYGSFIAATLGGKKQVVGHDADSLGGWDLATGKRLWRLVPPKAKDYNVPTPIVWNGHLLVTTENNGTRLYRFDGTGKIVPEPVAQTFALAHDTHSPVLVGNRLVGVHHELKALKLDQGLKPAWTLEDAALGEHSSLVATDARALILSQDGELLLVELGESASRILGRCRPAPEEKDLYSHPAFVGTRMYLRGNERLYAFDLAAKE